MIKGIYQQMKEAEEEARKNPPKQPTWEEIMQWLNEEANKPPKPYVIYCNEEMFNILKGK